MEGVLDILALEASISALLKRHESLRTVFPSEAGRPVQHVLPWKPIRLGVADLTGIAAELRDSMARRLACVEVLRRFDLARGPLVRFTLLRLGETRHILLLTQHHIICDEWSVGVFFREMSEHYSAFKTRAPYQLEQPGVQYAAFAVAQRESMQGAVLESLLADWHQQLGEDESPLELATDFPRPAAQTHRGASERFSIPEEVTRGVRRVGREAGCTDFMTFLGAFQILLHRYSGQDIVSVGTPIANRGRIELEGVVGLFLNPVVLRLDLGDDPTVSAALDRTRAMALHAYAHQELPFEKLVAARRPERDPGRHPLFQVMFILHETPIALPRLAGLELQYLELPVQRTDCDLTLRLTKSGTAISGSIEYSRDLFESATIRRMQQHFCKLLHGMAEHPSSRITQLPILTESERDQMLLRRRELEPQPVAEVVCLHELFELQVRRTPDRIALYCGDNSFSYGELDRRANRLASYLRSVGVAREARVGVCMQRSADQVVAVIAILKAGGAYVPLDPRYPQEWLSRIVADEGIETIVTTSHLRSALPAKATGSIELDRQQAEIKRCPSVTLRGGVHPDNLAYVLYTSGSTAKPKGVMGCHAAAAARIQWEACAFEAGEVCAHKTSLGFIDSLWEIFAPLSRGLSLVVVPEDTVSDPRRLGTLLRRHGVTRWVLVPSLLRALLDADVNITAELPVRYWISSGESLGLDLACKFLTAFPDATLINIYGTTEVWDATWYDVRQGTLQSSVPIGHPVSGAETYVVDGSLNPVPMGVPGELVVGGMYMARGYLGSASLTAERFVPHPFSSCPGARVYRTGDVVRYREGQTLEFLSRRDSQVKLRGFRIDTRVVEMTLEEHSAVRQAAVVLRETISGHPELCAHVVVDGESTSVLALRRGLQRQFPSYMVPSHFVFERELPMTPSGKLDRLELSARKVMGQTVAHVPPVSSTEQTIARIWQAELGIDRVGVNDNFFDLGGHSLLALVVISQIEKILQKTVSPREILFETLGQLAGSLDRAGDRTQDEGAWPC